jgi:hypothetical protein
MFSMMKETIPTWLETPPAGTVSPPVATKLQELPFDQLSWEAFEKLCLRLARLEADVEHCQLFGERGQDQEGIDLYARLKQSEKYRVYQCKREKRFGPSKINKAVNRFLEDSWADKSETLVLCTTESMVPTDRAKALEAEQAKLRSKGINLIPWDSNQLSIKLKALPEIVDDFFGRAWVEAFCGTEAVERLGQRLDAQGIAEFRRRFAVFYQRVFNKHDPGLSLVGGFETSTVLPIEERYVLPNVDDQHTIHLYQSSGSMPGSVSETGQYFLPNRLDDATPNILSDDRRRATHQTRSSYRQRHEIENWLSTAQRSVILGGPGTGKSTLLRFLIIDLLKESPTLSLLAPKWGQHLPVWVPFALWTKIISASPSSDASLKSFLHSWLKNWDEEGLWPLVERALEDRRLLLLVDGLDEWTNEQAAVIALQRLQVFIEQRNLPAIVTSRPNGFHRLGMQVTGWQVGRLSEFSDAQQRKLAYIWFLYWAHATSSIPQVPEEFERLAQAETEGFMAELGGSADIRELAKVPLLLTLLITHRSYNARLPQNRFKAYDSLIEHLLSTHPRMRRIAASLTQPSLGLPEEEVKRTLSYLAYKMQESFSEGIIEQTKAATIVEKFLKGEEGGFFDFDQFEARKYSREVLEIAENTAGLLVSRSPTELGFFHRAFQEYLAALFISNMDLTRQLELVAEKCVDPQWREVILALFHATNRQEDVRLFINQIRAKKISSIDKYAVESLLSEGTFGDFNCHITLARELAVEAFTSIELCDRMPHREVLLRHVLSGLRSTKVRELVKEKLREWFPQRGWWQQERLFRAMAKWSKLPEVVECLFRGLYDERINNQRQAAKSLAEMCAGDGLIGDRILTLASTEIDPFIRAAALEGGMRGWPTDERLQTIVEAARKSVSPELRLVGILGRIQQHVQTEEDQEEALNLGSSIAGLHFNWDDAVVTALITGWPGSQKTKDACLYALGEGRRYSDSLDDKLAGRILLEGFSQDDEVGRFCANEIEKMTKDDFSMFFSSNHENWKLLLENFKDHPLVVAAVDKWLPRAPSHRWVDIRDAVLIGRTDVAKAKLLSILERKDNTHWVAETLLKGWGMRDPEVASTLTQLASASSVEIAKIADLLSQIIEDRTECRKRLLSLLDDEELQGYKSTLLIALLTLEGGEDKSGLASMLIEHSPPSGWDEGNYRLSYLTELFPSDPRVHELARQELLNPRGFYEPIAEVYGDDEQIRKALIRIATPLPTALRKMIAAHLGESGDDLYSLSLLELYEYDDDDEVLSQGSLSYHTRLRASGKDQIQALEKLAQALVAVGVLYVERRQAALVGLLALNRVDIMAGTKETSSVFGEHYCQVQIIGGLAPNIPLLKAVLQNWAVIKEALGSNMWTRLADYPSNSNPVRFLESLCLFADEYPLPREDALTILQTERVRHPVVLRFIARIKPQSRLLLDNCFFALAGPSLKNYYYIEEATTAAELLGLHFGGDQEVLARLIAEHSIETINKDSFDGNLIMALCEGWPESEELEQIYEAAIKHQPLLSYPVYFHLICQKGSSEQIVEALLVALEELEENSFHRDSFVARPIIHRLQEDDELLNLMMLRINSDPSPSVKATFPRLIGLARGVSPELRAWCINQSEDQLHGKRFPDIGLDLVTGSLRPVVHSLLDLLNFG